MNQTVLTDQNLRLAILNSVGNTKSPLLQPITEYVSLGDYLITTENSKLNIHFCSQYLKIISSVNITTEVSREMSCYSVLSETVTVRGNIFKAYNFEKSIIFVIKDGTAFYFFRFEKINLGLSRIDDIIPATTQLLEIVEYN